MSVYIRNIDTSIHLSYSFCWENHFIVNIDIAFRDIAQLVFEHHLTHRSDSVNIDFSLEMVKFVLYYASAYSIEFLFVFNEVLIQIIDCYF